MPTNEFELSLPKVSILQEGNGAWISIYADDRASPGRLNKIEIHPAQARIIGEFLLKIAGGQ
jgi:hypothetical protein